MSEELLQRDLLKNPDKIGKWDFYNIGATTVKALKEHGVIRNVDYGDEEKKKVDALIVSNKNVVAVIEFKKPVNFKTTDQKQNAIKQELEVARKLGANIIIATDTIDTVWVNVSTGNYILNEDGTKIITKFNPKDEKLPIFIEKINASINELNDQIKPKELVNPTGLAKQIWQDVWSVSGATPENCLYTFVELFIFKYLSDLGVLKEPENFDFLIKLYEKRDANDVLEYYATNVRPKIKRDLFPQGQDGTTIINGTIFVSKDQKAVAGYSNVFKKVLLKFQDYGKLENIDYDFKSQLFESFLKESISKKNWGQFFTPLKVVRAIAEMAKDEIKVGAKICDPACGVGKFLLEPVVTKLHEFYEVKNNKVIPKITIHGYDKGFDKDEQRTIILAKANMLIYFSDIIKENPALTKEFAELFNNSFELKTNSILGTLSETPKDEYDLILTNPPYVTSGSSNLKDEIKKDGSLMNYYKINAVGVEGLFMEWIVRALKPNGKAFIVIPDGIFNRQNDKNLRQFIIDECYIDGVISLPLNTFFTTNKKTYILCLTKKADKKDIQKDPVFCYLVSEVGESRDVYRFDIEQNDLNEATTLYSFFKGNKIGFEKINTDKRCKILPFSDFEKNIENSWIIDKWWSEEEKIELGISEKKDKLDLLEFSSLVEDVALSVKGFQEEIKELSEKKKPNLVFKTFVLKDVFDIERGSGKFIKRYTDTHKGSFPVYSGNTFGAFSHIDTYDYEKPCISWVIDGLAGYIMLHNEKFSATNHRGVLIPKDSNISLPYAKFILEPIFRNSKKGRIGANGKNEYTALPPFMIENIEFELPVDENGNIDLDSQNEFVDKINAVEEIKNEVQVYREQIQNTSIEIDNMGDYQAFKIKDIFDLNQKTNNSKFTKKFIEKNKGEIPVYSASKFPDAVDYGYVKDNLTGVKYFENCLTWNIDGSIGNVHYRSGRFSLSEKVLPLIVKDNFKSLVDLTFLKYEIQNEFAKHGFGFTNKAGKGKIQNIEINIPTSSGVLDIQIQRDIAEKYQKIEQIKERLVEELGKVKSSELNFW